MSVSTTIDSTLGVVSTVNPASVADGLTISQPTTFSSNVSLSNITSLLLKSLLVTPAGTTQGTATALASDYTLYLLDAAAANRGVRLPAAPTQGQVVVILNTTVNDKKVYPATGGIIGAALADAAIVLSSMVAGTSRGGAILICSDATAGATKWHHFAVVA
jgi:hypothetical protein